MRKVYGQAERPEATTALAKEVVNLLVTSGVTFQQADDTLMIAQEMLSSETKPVRALDEANSRAEELTPSINCNDADIRTITQAICDRMPEILDRLQNW